MPKWTWEKNDAARSGSSGDLAKMFKNEMVRQPALLAVNAPPAEDTLLARELIQNSWDAARELQESEPSAEFAIEFVFRQLSGDSKSTYRDQLGLDELADRASLEPEERAKLGLASHDVLEHLDDGEPLRVLEIRESGTTGMYGPFTGPKSKLYLALVSIGGTAKLIGAGGSYGYGKAGLIRGSKIRTVLAYTCFRPEPEELEVTRRLLGMTYWGFHDLDGDSFNGFARLGDQRADATMPFENDDADAFAATLGLSLRHPDNMSDLGTTFLLVDPTVTPETLRSAIERSWWPALKDNCFAVEIRDYDGERIVPRPKQDPTLATFMSAYELATHPQDSVVAGTRSRSLSSFEIEGNTYSPGTLGLVSDTGGWSYPQPPITADEEQAAPANHRSLVALIRSPRMVVEYYDAGQSLPYVRGAFVATEGDHPPAIDDLLRQTEPKLHDSWDTSVGADEVHPVAPQVAKRTLDRIRRQVNEFRKSLKPPTPDRKDLRLPVLEELFKDLLSGTGPHGAGPDPTKREVSIHMHSQALELVPGSDDIRLRAKVGFSLSSNYELADTASVEIGLRYVFIEDNHAGQACQLTVTLPDGFEPVEGADGVFLGELGRESVIFDFVSEPYSADWTARLSASADIRPPLVESTSPIDNLEEVSA